MYLILLHANCNILHFYPVYQHSVCILKHLLCKFGLISNMVGERLAHQFHLEFIEMSLKCWHLIYKPLHLLSNLSIIY